MFRKALLVIGTLFLGFAAYNKIPQSHQNDSPRLVQYIPRNPDYHFDGLVENTLVRFYEIPSPNQVILEVINPNGIRTRYSDIDNMGDLKVECVEINYGNIREVHSANSQDQEQFQVYLRKILEAKGEFDII